MKSLAILLHCFSALLSAAVGDPPLSPLRGGRLVEITYASDNRGEFEMFHTVTTCWITENKVGRDDHIWDYSERGGRSEANNGLDKAAEIRRLLTPIIPPKTLPANPNEIVTVMWRDGQNIDVRRFPVTEVPAGVYKAFRIIAEAGGWVNERSEGFRFPLADVKSNERSGADQPATKPADKVPAEVQPPTPKSKDAPR